MMLPVLNLTNLRVPVGAEESPCGEELEADQNLWRTTSLPDTVPPNFRTCNIARWYQLEIILGLSYSMQENIEVRVISSTPG